MVEIKKQWQSSDLRELGHSFARPRLKDNPE